MVGSYHILREDGEYDVILQRYPQEECPSSKLEADKIAHYNCVTS